MEGKRDDGRLLVKPVERGHYTHLKTIKNVLTPCWLEQTNGREGHCKESLYVGNEMDGIPRNFKLVDVWVVG